MHVIITQLPIQCIFSSILTILPQRYEFHKHVERMLEVK
jgi:hypothetical protein